MTIFKVGNAFPDLSKVQGSSRRPLTDQVIYFGTAGSDSTGNGTFTQPYRTPAHAQLQVPHGATGFWIIEALDVGPFDGPPPLEVRGNGLSIALCGSRQTPDALWSAPAPSISLVAGKYGQYNTTSLGFGATVTDGSHWIEDLQDAPYDNYPYGHSVRASVSPTVTHINPWGALYGTIKLHPMTTFQYGVTSKYSSTGPANLSPTSTSMKLVGIRIENKFIDYDNGIFAVDVDLEGCTAPVSITFTATVRHADRSLDVVTPSISTYGEVNISGVVGFVSVGAGYVYLSNLVVGPGTAPALAQCVYSANRSVFIQFAGGVDFEKTTVNVTRLLRVEVGWTGAIIFNNSVSVDAIAVAAPASLITTDQYCDGVIFAYGGSLFTGTISGSAFVLAGRHIAGGLAATLTGLTRGSDATIGDLGIVSPLVGPFPKLSPNRGTIVHS